MSYHFYTIKLLILIFLAVDKENANADSVSRIPITGMTSNLLTKRNKK